MSLLPIPLLISLFTGLLSIAILIAAASLLHRALRRYRSLRGPVVTYAEAPVRPAEPVLKVVERPVDRRVPAATALRDTGVAIPLLAALLLLFAASAGHYVVLLAYPSGSDEPRALSAQNTQTLARPDGTQLHIETFGNADGPALVFTHGWGTSNTEWYYAKRHLADRYRLVVWDLPGLGKSTGPSNGDYSLEKMARDLEAVLAATSVHGGVLVGHSIGGMINLTFCRLFPDRLGSEIKGVVEVDTTYTNPVRTTKGASISEALQKPVAEPLLHLIVWTSPVVRAMNWLSYQNGTAHIMNAQSSFAGAETRGQLDLVSSYQYKSSPGVVSRGTLGMFHWDAEPVLPAIKDTGADYRRRSGYNHAAIGQRNHAGKDPKSPAANGRTGGALCAARTE